MKFSSPPKMKYGILATVVKREEEKGTKDQPKLAIFESRLTAMLQLANRLWPTSGSQYVMMQIDILERVNKFLCLYITPRLVHAREGGPLLEHATNQSLPKEVMEGINLAFLFEAIQLERNVPLAKYNVQDEEESAPEHGLAPLSRLEQDCNTDTAQEIADLQQQQSHLKKENDYLKAKIEQLEAKLAVAVSVLENYMGKKVTDASSSSSNYDETPPSDTPSLQDDSETKSKALPTIRCSWPYGSDMPAASTSGRSTPDRLGRRPECHEDYLDIVRTKEGLYRRSGFVGAQGPHGLGIHGLDPLMQGTAVVRQNEERDERSLSRE